MNDSDIREQFEQAVEVSRWALAEVRAQPTVKSKRRHDILNPLWVVYRDASALAVKWARERRFLGEPAKSFDDELSELLGDG